MEFVPFRASIARNHTSSASGNEEHRVDYVPGEGTSYLFGGNSNWRGPIWFPINFLIVEALERYHLFYGESFKVECPTGSGNMMTLKQVAQELSRRLASIFLPDENGTRPCHGEHLQDTRAIRIGAIWCSSTNTSTAKPAAAAAQAIKPAGQPWQ